MSTSKQDHARTQTAGSVLDLIPTPDEIRDQMRRNAEDNRVLRTLFRLSRRLADRNRHATEQRQGVPHV